MMHASIFLGVFLVFVMFTFVSASAQPPLERVPLKGIEVLGADDPTAIKADKQVSFRTHYTVEYPNTDYTIIFQILDEKNQVVSLSWIESYHNATSIVRVGSYICGDKICHDKWAPPESFVCGDKMCQKSPLGPKSTETSWIPPKPGKYSVYVFAWEALDNPNALSAPMQLDVTVA